MSSYMQVIKLLAKLIGIMQDWNQAGDLSIAYTYVGISQLFSNLMLHKKSSLGTIKVVRSLWL